MKRKQQLYDKYNGHCAYCGTPLGAGWQTDHIVPKCRGGTDDIENLAPACRPCNASKAGYGVEQFRVRLIDDVARLRRDSAKFRILERFGLVAQVKNKVVFYGEVQDEKV